MPAELVVKCHWCTQTFKTNREMKNHAASIEHFNMRVVCPWCLEGGGEDLSQNERTTKTHREASPVTNE